MRSITKSCEWNSDDKIQINRPKFKKAKHIMVYIRSNNNDYCALSIQKARKLFQAGLQMCDDLEKENFQYGRYDDK